MSSNDDAPSCSQSSLNGSGHLTSGWFGRYAKLKYRKEFPNEQLGDSRTLAASRSSKQEEERGMDTKPKTDIEHHGEKHKQRFEKAVTRVRSSEASRMLIYNKALKRTGSDTTTANTNAAKTSYADTKTNVDKTKTYYKPTKHAFKLSSETLKIPSTVRSSPSAARQWSAVAEDSTEIVLVSPSAIGFSAAVSSKNKASRQDWGTPPRRTNQPSEVLLQPAFSPNRIDASSPHPPMMHSPGNSPEESYTGHIQDDEINAEVEVELDLDTEEDSSITSSTFSNIFAQAQAQQRRQQQNTRSRLQASFANIRSQCKGTPSSSQRRLLASPVSPPPMQRQFQNAQKISHRSPSLNPSTTNTNGHHRNRTFESAASSSAFTSVPLKFVAAPSASSAFVITEMAQPRPHRPQAGSV